MRLSEDDLKEELSGKFGLAGGESRFAVVHALAPQVGRFDRSGELESLCGVIPSVSVRIGRLAERNDHLPYGDARFLKCSSSLVICAMYTESARRQHVRSEFGCVP